MTASRGRGRPRNPNKKPRIQVSVDSETKDVIQRLADALGSSVAAIAGSILEDNRKELEIAATAMEESMKNPKSSSKALHLAMIELQRAGLQAHEDFINDEPDQS